MEPITLFGVEFLPHTWPLVFGIPAILVLGALVGSIYEFITILRK